MKYTGLRENEQYYKIENYTMKCRLYPNQETAKKIDAAIRGVQTFYNCTLWEIYNNHACTQEKPEKEKTQDKQNQTKKNTSNKKSSIKTTPQKPQEGEKKSTRKKEISKKVVPGYVHFVDFSQVGKATWTNKMRNEHPSIANAPASAIVCKSGVVADMKRSFGKSPIEFSDVDYYSNKHKRNSYIYQECLSKISCKENRDVFYIDLAKVGVCKVRGWNQRLRFDENYGIDFLDYAMLNSRKQVTIAVSRDNCGEYWICFKLGTVYRPMQKHGETMVGVDVGIKDIAILSDGTKYENKKFKKNEKDHLTALDRRLSRRQGWSNEKFREQHRKDPSLSPSKNYEETKISKAKLERRIARRRAYYNNLITKDIVANNEFIGVESLNVSGMLRNRHLAYALSDAALYSILQMLDYKSGWYNRIVQPIDMWTPSSKRCSHCGYILPKLSLSVREWVCPECGEFHDRDINAAQNILKYAVDTYSEQTANAV